jgi:hypothetical protein
MSDEIDCALILVFLHVCLPYFILCVGTNLPKSPYIYLSYVVFFGDLKLSVPPTPPLSSLYFIDD